MSQRENDQGINRCQGPSGKGPVLADWVDRKALAFRVPRVHIDTSVHDVVPMLKGAANQGVFAVADDGGEVGWISAGEIGTAVSRGLIHQLPDVTLRSCGQADLGGIDLHGGIHELSERFSELGRSVLPVFDQGRCVGDLRIEELLGVMSRVANVCFCAQNRSGRSQVQLTPPVEKLRPLAVGPWINRVMRTMMDASRAY